MNYTTISPEELGELPDPDVIDVRTPAEFGELHAPGARNIPLSTFQPNEFLASRNGKHGKPIYVMCRTGSRAAKACEKLAAAGCANVVHVTGGVDAWNAVGLPVVRGKKAMSLERQVRIVAGFFVVLGAILGYFVNINFVWLSAFFGAGLMYAGLTDTCGMALMLAKMPWNQRACGEQCAT
jgi:rhodanese-related sulfurtransferase